MVTIIDNPNVTDLSTVAIDLPEPINPEFLPVISPTQFAVMVDRSLCAVQHWTSTSKLAGAARRRGHHLLIWRERAIAISSGQSVQRGRGGAIGLTAAEIKTSFSDPYVSARFPLLLSPESLAELLGVGRSTIYKWKALGYLDGTFHQRSDGIRFTRRDVLLKIFNGEEWL